MIIKKSILILWALICAPTCQSQSDLLQLKYIISKSDAERVYFPVQQNGDITNLVEREVLLTDTLVIFINTKISKQIDTLMNGAIVTSSVCRHKFYYGRRHFSHYYSPQENRCCVPYIRLIIDEEFFLFRKKNGNKYCLVNYSYPH